jgi:hypothetical protein
MTSPLKASRSPKPASKIFGKSEIQVSGHNKDLRRGFQNNVT